MISSLFGTKLHQPSLPSKRIQRAKLIHALNANVAAGRLLTLVSAPAGFGKTTLVSEWARDVRLPVAWLSLDRADDDPSRFFAYLIRALQKVNENTGREIESVLNAGQLPPFPAIAASLVNDILAAEVPFLLVLDDFQVIEDQAILDVLGMILANPPEQLHLILITREDPPLPLGRLRANNQMTEIRAADLRFTEREAGLFLNEVMGLSLSETDIAAMGNRTEGWAAGLQLAAIAMHDRDDLSGFITHLNGSNRYILSYLTEEVLRNQPEEIQAFLSQTSILDALCGDLCDTVTGRSDSRALLERCFHANLFLVPLDDEGRWYRYHHLFRDLLQNQQSRFSEGEISELHRRASRWYEEAGMAGESIEHALVAADYGRAAQLLEAHAPGMIMDGYLKTVEGWMQAIPSERQSHNPRANLAFAWMHLLRGSYSRVIPYLEQARQAIWESDAEDEAGRCLRAEWLALHSTILSVQGEAGQSIELANQALQWAGTEDYFVKSLAYAALGGGYRQAGEYAGSIEAFQSAIQNGRAGGHLLPEMLAAGGMIAMAIQHGRLHFATEAGSQALERLEQEGTFYSPMAGAVYATLSLACYEWNQLEKAASYLARGIQLSSLSGHNAVIVYGKTLLARVLRAQGDDRAATGMAQEAVARLAHGLPAWMKPEVASYLARFYLGQGNPGAAQAVLTRLGIPVLADPSSLPDPLTHPDGLKCLLALRFILRNAREGQGMEELQRGMDLAGCLVSRALPAQRMEIALQALLLRAQMAAIQGNMEASLAGLLQAVELAEPEGYVRTFLDEGPELTGLLKRCLQAAVKPGEPQAGFIRGLLALSTSRAPGAPGIGPEEMSLDRRLVEPLTEREMDVMRLIAEGLTYQEIAGRLFISLNTVRFYVKEIYSKLNANNRTQAIKAAQRHHLL